VIVRVDNIACYFGWLNRQVPNDACASILIRTLHILTGLLSCIIHFEHLPRLSNDSARLVDRLSRVSTTLDSDTLLLSSFSSDTERLMPLVNWLKDPWKDWNLPFRIVQHVKNVLNEIN
jgi:hypothetical protein